MACNNKKASSTDDVELAIYFTLPYIQSRLFSKAIRSRLLNVLLAVLDCDTLEAVVNALTCKVVDRSVSI